MMLNVVYLRARQLLLGFAAGVLLTVLTAMVAPSLAQAHVPAPGPSPAPNVQQMIEWCRQMMSQGGAMMQGMMNGACMGG